jgi:hypothetical protein
MGDIDLLTQCYKPPKLKLGSLGKKPRMMRAQYESHKQAVEVEVKVKLELDTGSRESGQTGQTNKGILTEEKTHKLN